MSVTVRNRNSLSVTVSHCQNNCFVPPNSVYKPKCRPFKQRSSTNGLFVYKIGEFNMIYYFLSLIPFVAIYALLGGPALTQSSWLGDRNQFIEPGLAVTSSGWEWQWLTVTDSDWQWLTVTDCWWPWLTVTDSKLRSLRVSDSGLRWLTVTDSINGDWQY